MKYHDWFNAGTDKSAFQTDDQLEYDGLGRLGLMVYPDGEELTYDYDAGGLAQTVNGVEEGLIRVQIGVDPKAARSSRTSRTPGPTSTCMTASTTSC